MGEPNFCHVFCAVCFELCFGITCFCSHTHCVCFDTMCVVFIVVFGSCAFIYIIIIIIISIIIMTSFSLFVASCAHYYSPLLSCHLSIMPLPPLADYALLLKLNGFKDLLQSTAGIFMWYSEMVSLFTLQHCKCYLTLATFVHNWSYWWNTTQKNTNWNWRTQSAFKEKTVQFGKKWDALKRRVK